MRSAARKRRIDWLGYPFLQNVHGVEDAGTKRRALLIYLTEPFQLREDDTRFLDHQNLKQCRQIASLLDEAGYLVDVADYQDDKLVQGELPRQYDLIVSHRGDLGRAGAGLASHTVKVYLASGMNHTHYNRNLLRRYERLSHRRSCTFAPPELNREDLPFVDAADAVAGFGNGYTTGTWRERVRGPVLPFNNYGALDGGSSEKDYARAARNFLFFASRNQVGKGLDLLLEIFPRHPDLHLHVCSLFEYEPDFSSCYRRELYETPNIHTVGVVKVGTPEFRRILADCAFIIHPSCSEGQPGSVVQAMHAGLIPLVTKESGIDVAGFGWVFDNDTEEVLEQAIVRVTALGSAELRQRAARTQEAAQMFYSEKAFLSRWREIIGEIDALARTKGRG